RSRPAAPRADDVHARVRARVLGASFRRDVLDAEAAAREIVADEARAVLVRVAGRIDGGDADQVARVRDDLVARAVDVIDDPIGELRGRQATYCSNVASMKAKLARGAATALAVTSLTAVSMALESPAAMRADGANATLTRVDGIKVGHVTLT